MRVRLLLLFGLLTLTVLPALGQSSSSSYQVKLDGEPKVWTEQTEGGGSVTKALLEFKFYKNGREVKTLDGDYRVTALEEKQKVAHVDVRQARVKHQQELSAILAVDISGSMSEGIGEKNRMFQAKQASNAFFAKLPRAAEAGLVLFDHEIRVALPLSKDRAALKAKIDEARPQGGTAYLDACLHAINMLKVKPTTANRQKAVIIMTDGMDLNSKHNMQQVIDAAKKAGVKVFTIGIGNPSMDEKQLAALREDAAKKGDKALITELASQSARQQDVTSVLVLDRSGSMLLSSDDNVKISKLEALKAAAHRFIEIMPEQTKGSKLKAKTTIFQFSDDTVLGIPYPIRKNEEVLLPYFTNNRVVLNKTIDKLEAKGETALFDATYDAIAALEAQNPPGNKVVVALTDGIDNVSRRRSEEVIKRAKDAGIKLYMLAFGREGELDKDVMNKMATETSGKFYHVTSPDKLMEIFENLSVLIHDEGIDEGALIELAVNTGGKYYLAKNISDLKLILERVTQSIEEPPHSMTFRTINQAATGVDYTVTLQLSRLRTDVVSGDDIEEIVDITTGKIRRSGMLMAQTSPSVYLGFLVLLGLLILVPMGLGRMGKKAA